MRTEGSTVTGGSYSGIPHDHGLPKPTTHGVRPAHRPWCLDCKRHHDADQLNDDQLCARCAKAAASRAAAAERRAAEAQARAEEAEREKAAQRADQTHAGAHVINAGAAAASPVRAKVTQGSTGNGVLISLSGDNLAHRQTEIAGLLADLLAGLNTTPAPAATPAPSRRTTPRTSKPRRRRTTSFPLEHATQLLHDGHSVPQIATELGCAVSTARRHLQRAGITIPDGRTTHSGGNTKTTHDDDPHLRDTIVDRYTAGDSTVTLARDLDLTPKQVNAILRRAGVTIRPRASVGKPIDEEDVLTRYAEGASIVAIARDLGVHATRIRALLAGRDIQIRPKGNATQIHNRLTDLGVTARDVKEWAHAQGLIDQIRSGLVAGHLIDAYENAHNPEGATA